MVKQKPGLIKTKYDDLTYQVNGLAMQVHNELKPGHPEKFYQRRLAELCRQAGLEVEVEKRVEVWIGEMVIGYMFLDLWIENRLVVECKAFSHLLTNDEVYQCISYLVATGTEVGMLYNFGLPRLDYRRILPPSQVQNWQSSLYRSIWVKPEFSLPPLDTQESVDPICFVVQGLDRIIKYPISPSAHPLESAEAIRSSAHPLESAEAIRSSVHPLESAESIRSSVHPLESVESIRSSVHPLESVESIRSSVHPLESAESIRSSVHPLESVESIRSSVHPLESADNSAYAASGVSIDAGNRAVELMKSAVKATYTPAVLSGIGSFGGLFDASALKQMQNPVLVASTDGVGTKVKLAAAVGRYRGIGQDIVNHCIDDILVQGARPLFFMDYFATSKLDPEQTAEVVTGMAQACQVAGMALLGGETAEMPGVYQSGEFDVAGTIVGILERDQVLPRVSALQTGDVLIGLTSSGPHTNGYSLIRKVFADTPLETVFPELDQPLAEALLAPHRSYLNVLYPHLGYIKALAHLTGGGFIENIPRVLPDHLDALIRIGSWPVPPLWRLIQQKGNIPSAELYRVFNMGIGMVLMVAPESVSELQQRLPEETFVIGELIPGTRKTILS